MPASARRLVVGLGNPGAAYRATRHNLGFRVVEALAERQGAAWALLDDPPGRLARFVADRPDGTPAEVALLEPGTYMNASGDAVGPLCAALGLDPATELLVVVDDLALAPGRLRLRPGGSDGGHNGLASVAGALGTERYPRLRIGIGAPRGDQVEYVLAPFAAAEAPVVEAAVARAADCVLDWIRCGTEACAERYNRPAAPPEDGGRAGDPTEETGRQTPPEETQRRAARPDAPRRGPEDPGRGPADDA